MSNIEVTYERLSDAVDLAKNNLKECKFQKDNLPADASPSQAKASYLKALREFQEASKALSDFHEKLVESEPEECLDQSEDKNVETAMAFQSDFRDAVNALHVANQNRAMINTMIASLHRVSNSKNLVHSFDTAISVDATIAVLRVAVSSLDLVIAKCHEDLRLIQEAYDEWIRTGN